MSSNHYNVDYQILLIDDEADVVNNFEFALSSIGKTNVIKITDSRQVKEHFRNHSIGIVFLDLMMPHVSGRELLSYIKMESPQTLVVIVTAVDDVRTAVECMKEGAADYLIKPVKVDTLCTTLHRMEDQLALSQEIVLLRKSLLSSDDSIPEAFNSLTTVSDKMFALIRYANGIAQTEYPVLITGETGVGKELIAKSIHLASKRKGEFVPVNIAGLGAQEIADVLFGHCRGAFTGADRERQGLISRAENGTLFLDEIGDMTMDTQVKLLRFLADRSYYPLGSDAPCYSNTRIIAATNRPLADLEKSPSFRRDLLYRLNTHSVEIPPLRQRRNDIPVLLNRFIEEASHQQGKTKPALPPALYQLINTYDFPGNVRELQALAFDTISQHTKGILSTAVFEKRILSKPVTNPDNAYTEHIDIENSDTLVFPKELPPLGAIEPMLIHEAMKRADGNQSLAAKLLKVPRKTLNTRISRMKTK